MGISLASLFENPSVLNARELAALHDRKTPVFPTPFPVRFRPPHYKQKHPQGVFLLTKAGAVGIEPTHSGVKVRCLTAWLRPSVFPFLYAFDDTESPPFNCPVKICAPPNLDSEESEVGVLSISSICFRVSFFKVYFFNDSVE